MKIGIAQIKPLKGAISFNIEKHIQCIELAHSVKADSIFFPELSLTGYEPELAKELATIQEDTRFDVFQEISNLKNITIGIGVPTRSENGVQISMVVFQPNASRATYSKQQLHEDEFPYFVSGNKQLIIPIENKKVIPAICYESLQIEHADNAIKLGGEIYLASVAKSQNGIDKAIVHYPEVAKKYAIPVLMSNCIGECDTFINVGLSAVWTKKGILVDQLDSQNEGILVFNTETEKVIKKLI
ncbi:carbon-nitrogen hydrolase family protein [Flavobacterium sp. WC2509]|uniref:carbon-nitrogen hydrolase family protein n=1 Tax=Flavobacterium sp. WC2509 TaxID=3461406 RepID=UPI004043AB60